MDAQIQVEAMVVTATFVSPVKQIKISSLVLVSVMPAAVASPVSVISVGNAAQHAIPAPTSVLRKDKLALSAV